MRDGQSREARAPEGRGGVGGSRDEYYLFYPREAAPVAKRVRGICGTGTSDGAPRPRESAVQSAAPRSRTVPSNNPAPRSATREKSAAARTAASSESASLSASAASQGGFVSLALALALALAGASPTVVVVVVAPATPATPVADKTRPPGPRIVVGRVGRSTASLRLRGPGFGIVVGVVVVVVIGGSGGGGRFVAVVAGGGGGGGGRLVMLVFVLVLGIGVVSVWSGEAAFFTVGSGGVGGVGGIGVVVTVADGSGDRDCVGNWVGGRGGGDARVAWSGTRPGSSCASALAPVPAPAAAASPLPASEPSSASAPAPTSCRSPTRTSPVTATTAPSFTSTASPWLSPSPSPSSLSLSLSLSSSSPISIRARSFRTAARYGSSPASGGVALNSSRFNPRAVLAARKPHVRLRARSGSSAASGVGGSSSCGAVVRESVVVAVEAGVGMFARAGARGIAGSVITVLCSRKVTCRSTPRRRCAAGDGAGMMNFIKKVRRKERMAMMSIRLVALNTNKVWSSRAGMVPEVGGPRGVCAEGFIGGERPEGGGGCWVV
jgi:hypothetical protein